METQAQAQAAYSVKPVLNFFDGTQSFDTMAELHGETPDAWAVHCTLSSQPDGFVTELDSYADAARAVMVATGATLPTEAQPVHNVPVVCPIKAALRKSLIVLARDLSQRRMQLHALHGDAYPDAVDSGIGETVIALAEACGLDVLEDNARQYEKGTQADIAGVDFNYFTAILSAL